MLKLYLAAPLFSDAERTYNHIIKNALRACFDVYLPQEDGGLLVDMISEGMPIEHAMREVFHTDIQALKNCDVFIIVLDGRVIDEGAAFELGYAYMLGKPCYGIKTDPRQLLKYGDNPMIHCSLNQVFPDVSHFISWAEKSLLKEGSSTVTSISADLR